MGAFLLANLSDEVLRRLLGIFTLIIFVYKLVSDSLRSVTYQPQNWHGYLAGWGAGFASSLANAGGPPVTAYMLLQKIDPTSFVGTMTLFFFTINLIKMPIFGSVAIIDVDQLLRIAWVLPLIPLGVWVGRRVIGWINPVLFNNVMMVLLFIASMVLLFGTPSH